jgi:hypothetical protein
VYTVSAVDDVHVDVYVVLEMYVVHIGGVNDGAAKAMLDQLTWWGDALREARLARPYAV